MDEYISEHNSNLHLSLSDDDNGSSCGGHDNNAGHDGNRAGDGDTFVGDKGVDIRWWT